MLIRVSELGILADDLLLEDDLLSGEHHDCLLLLYLFGHLLTEALLSFVGGGGIFDLSLIHI